MTMEGGVASISISIFISIMSYCKLGIIAYHIVNLVYKLLCFYSVSFPSIFILKRSVYKTCIYETYTCINI